MALDKPVVLYPYGGNKTVSVGCDLWPEVFETGVCNTTDKREAVAQALMGWGLCHAGASDLPKNFGRGMMALGCVIGELPLPDTVSEIAKRIMAEHEEDGGA